MKQIGYMIEIGNYQKFLSVQWFPTLGNPGVLGLQLRETPISTASGEDLWELHSKNTWDTQGWKPLF